MKLNFSRLAIMGIAATSALAMQAAPFTLPAEITPTSEQASNMIIVNANGDNYEWRYGDNCMEYETNWARSADDWFFVPVTVTAADAVLDVQYSAQSADDRYPEKMSMAAGNAATAAAMTQTFPEAVIPGRYTEYRQLINNTVGAGTLYIGFHCTSDADTWKLRVKDIRIAAISDPVPPAPTVVESAIDLQTFTATVSIPEKTVTGTDFDGKLTLNVSSAGAEAPAVYTVTPGATQKVELRVNPGEQTVNFKLIYETADGKSYESTITSVTVTAEKEPVIYSLPFSMAPTEEQFEECIIVDANGDKTTWDYNENNEAFWYKYDWYNDADDWLILPGINPGDYEKVKIDFDVKVQSTSYTEKFDVCAGLEPKAEGMEVLMQCYDGLTTTFETRSIEMDVKEAGKPFYLAFHAISPKEQHSIYIRNINVEGIENGGGVGVEAVSVERMITAANGEITIAGCAGENATVYTLDGRMVANTTLADITTIPVAGGIYIVKVADSVCKVIVK